MLRTLSRGTAAAADARLSRLTLLGYFGIVLIAALAVGAAWWMMKGGKI